MTEYENDTTTSLAELLASQPANNTSRLHGVMIHQAANPSDAVLYALDVIRGGEPADRAETLSGMQARIDRLVNVSTDDAQRELAGHCVLLDELFALYTIQAQHTRNIEVRVKLQKLGLQAQSAHSRALALLATLAAQKHGRAKLVLHDDDGGRGDDQL